MISTQIGPSSKFPIWEKSVPDSEIPIKVNGLCVIEKNRGNWKLVVFTHQGEEINEEYIRQGIDPRSVVAFNHSGIAV